MIKFFLEGEHGVNLIVGLCILLSINVLFYAGKFLFSLFQKKSEKHDSHIKEFDEKIRSMTASVTKTEAQLGHLMNILSSYMETTLDFATKMGAVEKQILDFSEKMVEVEERFSDLSKYDNDMRKFSNAIKWLAGNRWDELREAILEEDDFRT